MSFFSEAKHRFQAVPEDGKIETSSFLDACSEVVPFFDVLGPTAFAPVKSDINGNIKKLRAKYDSNPQQFRTLQDIVESEIEKGTTQAKNSSTDALLWLKRALTFIRLFLETVLSGEHDLVKCATKAYESSLKQYHGWMVQKIFSLAMKAVPYYEDFIKALGKGKVEEQTVLEEMKHFVTELAANLDNINDFYQKTNQEVDKKV